MGKDAVEEKSRRPSKRRRAVRGIADYSTLNPNTLLKALLLITGQGGAIRLGYTSDLGAYAIGIYGDGDPYTDYVKPSEDINVYFEDLASAWE